MHLLIVEDDIELAIHLVDALKCHNIVADFVTSAEDALAWPDYDTIDVIVLDYHLPSMSGLDFINNFRARKHNTPIVVLTAVAAWENKVTCLDAGAEDYVVKPVRAEELAARCRSLARRSATSTYSLNLTAGDVTVDTVRQSAWIAGEEVVLSSTEFRLLRALTQHKGRWLSKAAATNALFQYEWEHGENAIEAHISRLRRKVGSSRIITKRGMGYKIAV